MSSFITTLVVEHPQLHRMCNKFGKMFILKLMVVGGKSEESGWGRELQNGLLLL